MTNRFATYLEIDLNALEQNYIFLKQKLSPKTKFLAVVKAFAYGSVANAVAAKLEALGIDYFAVAYTQEGVKLRQSGIWKPIMVLHPQPESFDQIIDHCLEPCLYSFRVLEDFLSVAKSHKQTNYPVHIKFNTGLNRLGFNQSQAEQVAAIFNQQSTIKMASLLSHLAASEDMNESDFSLQQIHQFENINSRIIASIGYQPIRHMCNTSGILNYKQAHFDMVRSGIGLYGFSNESNEHHELIPIATLKTHISQIHHLKKGESVGYNRAYVCDADTTIAVVPIGHADGIGRQYGHGNGQMIIDGKSAPIVGNVCMDMIMLNVTDIKCKEGDTVEVFGVQQSAEYLAERAGTISYELITGISNRVPRIVINN